MKPLKWIIGGLIAIITAALGYWIFLILLLRPAQPTEPKDVINPEPWEVRKWMDELDE